jgi:2-epi-5-epi-valiolone synthase
MPLGEARKHLRTVERVCDLAARMRLDRRGVLIAVGGGVCSDIVTLAASMIRRGVEHIRIPTTLIGHVDAGIGIKGAVNFHGLKSFIGCFYPPSSVLLDSAYLQSLPLHSIREGLSEILKMALILDAQLFARIERCGTQLVASRFQAPATDGQQIVDQAICLMLGELQQNPFENLSSQRLVDMGHTFSPTLEERSGFRMSHGEAVAIDMAFTCVIAAELGLMSRSDAARFVALLLQVGLRVSSPLLTADACHAAIQSMIAHRRGRLNLVVPTSIGAATFLGQEALKGKVLHAAIQGLTTLEAELRAPAASRLRLATRYEDAPNAAPVL